MMFPLFRRAPAFPAWALAGLAALAAAPTATAAAKSGFFEQGKASYEQGEWGKAEAQLLKLLKRSPHDAKAQEAAVLLTDVYLRQDKDDLAQGAVRRFQRLYGATEHWPRMLYFQGILHLRKGRNAEAAKTLAAAARDAGSSSLYDASVRALAHIVGAGGLTSDELLSVYESVSSDPGVGPILLERLGDERLERGRVQAAQSAYQEFLDRYPDDANTGRVEGKLKSAASRPREARTVLLMAPFSGEFEEVGKSLREGATLAFEEAKARGQNTPLLRTLDDQGNMLLGLKAFRRALREERIDAVIGPAMSDVATAVAIEVSARRLPVPMLTPTATTHGIAALGEGVFQLNVTTHALGQRIAEYAVDCLGLKDFAIVAPQTEYGYQQADAFASTVERKGGLLAAVRYVDPRAADYSEQFQAVREEALRLYFEKRKLEGLPELKPKDRARVESDSAIPLDGLFLPAQSGEEANKLASQAVFNKIRAQLLGSSGWHDRSLLLKASPASRGAVFSVDFQDNPKTPAYQTFSQAYAARWKRQPDRVSALAYDAARFLLQGLEKGGDGPKLIKSLRDNGRFAGVLGDIALDPQDGANQNTALFRVDKKAFVEVEGCPEKP